MRGLPLESHLPRPSRAGVPALRTGRGRRAGAAPGPAARAVQPRERLQPGARAGPGRLAARSGLGAGRVGAAGLPRPAGAPGSRPGLREARQRGSEPARQGDLRQAAEGRAPMKTAALCLAAALAAAAPAAPPIVFKDVTASSGIAFRHVHGGSGQKYYVETMGSGACWFDYDNDGDIDLYAVNSGALRGWTGKEDTSSRLYRNDGQGRFTDVTAAAGVGNDGRYGMG